MKYPGEIDLHDYLCFVKKYYKSFFLFGVVGAIFGFLFISFYPPTYISKTTIQNALTNRQLILKDSDPVVVPLLQIDELKMLIRSSILDNEILLKENVDKRKDYYRPQIVPHLETNYFVFKLKMRDKEKLERISKALISKLFAYGDVYMETLRPSFAMLNYHQPFKILDETIIEKDFSKRPLIPVGFLIGFFLGVLFSFIREHLLACESKSSK